MISSLAWHYPYASFTAMLALAAVPLLLRAGAGAPAPEQEPTAYQRVMIAIALALAILYAVRYLIMATKMVEGVDFFFYVTIARDYHVSSPAKYVYFPGVYRFWQAAMAIFGDELSTLQRVFSGVLAANALLIAMILATTLRSAPAAAFGGLWYIILAPRFEGLYGTTEPIATLFALTGLLAWSGKPLRRATGWWRALVLGAMLGVVVWTKQQGGLVTLGAAALLLRRPFAPVEERDCIWQLAAIPIAATVVLVAALLLEGEALAPLRAGLAMVGRYETAGSFAENARALFIAVGPAKWVMLGAFAIWAASLAIPRLRSVHSEPGAAVVAFCWLASLAALAQFAKRPYLHYALFAAPFVAIAVVGTAFRMLQYLKATRSPTGPFVAVAVAGVLAAPAVGGGFGAFQIWPPLWNPPVAHGVRWHESSDVASDLRELAAFVGPTDDLLVLPPRRTQVHFLLRNWSSSKPYAWVLGGGRASDAVTPTLDAVLVLHDRVFDKTDAEMCEVMRCIDAVATLPQRGFRKVAELKAMTLWRRDATPE